MTLQNLGYFQNNHSRITAPIELIIVGYLLNFSKCIFSLTVIQNINDWNCKTQLVELGFLTTSVLPLYMLLILMLHLYILLSTHFVQNFHEYILQMVSAYNTIARRNWFLMIIVDSSSFLIELSNCKFCIDFTSEYMVYKKIIIIIIIIIIDRKIQVYY